MGTIVASLNIDKTISISSESVIYAGENLTTNLIISIPLPFTNYDYYLEFGCPEDFTVVTDRLELFEGSIVFPLPNKIIKEAGRVNFQVVARLDNADQLIFKSSIASLRIQSSIGAEEILADEFNDVITKCVIATEDATFAANVCNYKIIETQAVINDALIAIADTVSAKEDSINKTLACMSATEESITATNQCISARDAAILASGEATCAAVTAINSSENADSAAQAANQATASLNQSLESCEDQRELLDSLYNDINNAYINGELMGKSAYQYAVDGGFSGTEEEFSYLLKQSAEINIEELDQRYDNPISNDFDVKNEPLDFCRKGARINILRIYSEKTIDTIPEGYQLFNPPSNCNIILDVLDSLNGEAVKSVSMSLPAPLYCIEGVRDEIIWDAEANKFVIVYRTKCINLANNTFSYLSSAEPNSNTAYYSSNNLTYDIAEDLYYECGSLPQFSNQYLYNNDIEGISMKEESEQVYAAIRLSRTLLSDTSSINNFLLNNPIRLIIKLKNEIKYYLPEEVNRELLNLTLINTKTYIRATSTDNAYYIGGKYQLDNQLYLMTKASLLEDNTFSGNITAKGLISSEEKNITLRDGATETMTYGEKAGLIIKNADGNQDASIIIDNGGNLSAGLHNNMKSIAERENTPKDSCFAYWSESSGRFITDNKYKISSFIRKSITDSIKVDKDYWTISNGKFEYTILNSGIMSDSIVFISYSDNSKDVASECGIHKYNPVVGEGSVKIISDTTPNFDIYVNLIIIGG